ncbi:hypothetical protein C7B64_12005 [Merismopedia glauca CCAP 1448/3]|uniref:Uncharacterized protein n=1 Tax=Merismopedia glauca CCAP 1448/3 TaxID=1296344 RepID=A0A2T1C354_9CYAN|nr:hypothetical protein C7B64_12005 [Merismopedia glauca CCAP 1448/3]
MLYFPSFSCKEREDGRVLEYRNLLSNYGRYLTTKELCRQLESWNFNAFEDISLFMFGGYD